MPDTIRVRIIVTRIDPLTPRLWAMVRHDLSRQITEYFHYRPEMGVDQGNVTVLHASVTPTVARVGLHAEAFAQAVGNMIREYGLPHRFTVQVAVLSMPSATPRDVLVSLHRSTDAAPPIEGVTVLDVAENQVLPEVGGDARA